MADTFNKKEKEKKKQQKKKEKEQRKAERKANKKDGQSWEDMIAYTDENGNITSTPPDPNKKKQVINEQDIVLGSRNVEGVMTNPVRKGRVTFFNKDKGYGFIKDLNTQESIFVHINVLTFELNENDQVSFETEKSVKGLSAINVKKV